MDIEVTDEDEVGEDRVELLRSDRIEEREEISEGDDGGR